MEVEIITLAAKKLIGIRMPFTLGENIPAELWRTFMPRKKEIKNKVNEELISMEIYENGLDLNAFNHTTIFEKWAAIEVTSFDNLPEGMESYALEGGKYAYFLHKTAERTMEALFDYIFKTWLPTSGFTLANRPHFGVMGEKYRGMHHPESEEGIWIPVELKKET